MGRSEEFADPRAGLAYSTVPRKYAIDCLSRDDTRYDGDTPLNRQHWESYERLVYGQRDTRHILMSDVSTLGTMYFRRIRGGRVIDLDER